MRIARDRMTWLVAVAAMLIGVAALAIRGPARALTTHHADFALIYTAVRGWTLGINPYDSAALDPVWLDSGGSDARRPSLRGDADLLYPPATFAVLAPVALWPWRIAAPLWTVLNVVMLAAGLAAIARVARWRCTAPSTWIFVGAALAFAPVHTSIGHGQTGLLVWALIALAQAARAADRSLAAGILLGLAAAVKPQLGLPFVAYEAWRGRWRTVGWASAVAALFLAIGAGRLALAQVDWVPALERNVVEFHTANDGNPTRTNPLRYQLINLHYPLHTFLESRTVVAGLVWAVAAVAGAAGFLRIHRLSTRPTPFVAVGRGRISLGRWVITPRASEDRSELLSLGLIGALALVIVYHRPYDAIVLLMPLAWSVDALRAGQRTAGLLVLVPIAVLFVPTPALLATLERAGHIPPSLATSRLWESVVMPHQAWAVAAMLVTFPIASRLAARAQSRRADAAHS